MDIPRNILDVTVAQSPSGEPLLRLGEYMPVYEMTDFAAARHFNNPTFSGTRIPGDVTEFLGYMNNQVAIGNWKVQEGYDTFCWNIFIPAPPEVYDPVVPLDSLSQAQQVLINSYYEARRVDELPVLTRSIPRNAVALKPANFLNVIVYTATQLAKEGTRINADFGIVNILASQEQTETPMPPATMIRNALGTNFGGSGTPLDPEAYIKSVDFWSKYVLAK